MWIRCPAGCLFQVEDATFDKWKPNRPQVNCPRCKRIFPRERFEPPGNLRERYMTRMPAPLTPLTPVQNAQRVVRMTAEVARSTSNLKGRRPKTMAETVNEILQQITNSQAPDLVARVCRQLVDSSLTVNFPTIYIYELLGDTVLKNFWQVPRGEDWNHEKYGHDRESTELALHPLRPLPPSNLGLRGKPGLSRSEYGTREQRPISAALNIAYFYGGAAPMYGTSYLVLRNAVKQRCTFTAGDSLEQHWKKKLFLSSVGTSDQLVPVLFHMSRPALECVANLALNISAPKQGSGPQLQYVEAQVFGGINLMSDVLAMVIDEDELAYWLDSQKGIPEIFKNAPRKAREQAIESLRTTLEMFCKKHKIVLHYIKSGKGTDGSYSPQQVYTSVRFRWQG